MPSNKREKLIAIPKTEWSALRDVYRRDWPLNASSYYALENYIKWSQKDPELCEREVRIWSVNEEWREHGIYLLEDQANLCHIVRVDFCSQAHSTLFQTVLKFTATIPYTELLFRDKTRSAVKKHLEQLGYKPEIKQCYPAKLYQLRKEDCLKLDVSSRSDFIIQPLKLSDAKEVDDFWTYKAPGTQYLLERNIKYNASLGAYHPESGELCAWVLHSELGTIGCLYVKNDYRRRGLAEDLVRQMCRMLAETDSDAIAQIVDTNAASLRLFTKLGFQAVEYNYWFLTADFASDMKGSGRVDVQSGQAMKHG